MSTSKSIKLDATKTSERTLRGIVLVMALAALLFPVAAWADTILLESGTLTILTEMPAAGSILRASGPDFAITAISGLGSVLPQCNFCSPGDTFSTRTGIGGAEGGGITAGGVTYSIIDGGGFPPGTSFASWLAAGAPIVLPPIGPALIVTEPFTISLQASLFDAGFASRGITAAGGGEVTFTFAPGGFGPI